MGHPYDGVLAVIIIKDGGDLYLLRKENAQDKTLCEKASLQNSMNYLIPFMKNCTYINIYLSMQHIFTEYFLCAQHLSWR